MAKDGMGIPGNHIEIRQRECLTKSIDEEPDTETWLNQDRTEQDIDVDIRNSANRKAHGNDGIHGVEYKANRQWEIKPIGK